MGNNKKYVSFDFHAFILYTAQGQEDQGGVGEKGKVFDARLIASQMSFCHRDVPLDRVWFLTSLA